MRGIWHRAAVVLAAVVWLQAGVAQEPKPDQLHTMSRDELDVVKVLVGQEKAWNAGDIDGYAKAYKDSPELLFIGGRITHGFTEVLIDYHKSYPTKESMGTLAYSEIEPHLLSEKLAVVVGKYHLERSKKGGGSADGFFSLVLEKTDQGWKIIVDHSV